MALATCVAILQDEDIPGSRSVNYSFFLLKLQIRFRMQPIHKIYTLLGPIVLCELRRQGYVFSFSLVVAGSGGREMYR